MFDKLMPSKKSADKLVIDSLLAQDAVVHGDLAFAQGMQIDGSVTGDVKGRGPGSVLVVGKSAVIEGSIEADHIFIDGEVRGPVKAHAQIVVRAHGKIIGDVHYGRIQMEEGATVRGALHPLPLPEESTESHALPAAPALA